MMFCLAENPSAMEFMQHAGGAVRQWERPAQVPMHSCQLFSINQSITRLSSKRGTQEGSHSQTTFGDF
jgi:hypothetical protein